MKYGRFTASGGADVEALATRIVSEAADVLGNALPAKSFRTLALIGGYGRGEGGVETTVCGEVLHNNLDFLLIVEDSYADRQETFKAQAEPDLEAIAGKYGIGLDLGVISVGKLRHSPCLVMWYDVRFGHKTILGDADFLPSLTQFTAERILPSDARNLLINRGALLVINEALMDQGDLTPAGRKTIIRHAMKAIIGYGDALLFFLGDYDWSYREKRDRMRKRRDVPEAFQAVYDNAIAFRFQPDYAAFEKTDLPQWMRELRATLEPIHLRAESLRLQRASLTWELYPEIAYSRILKEAARSPRTLARSARSLLRPLPAAKISSPVAQIGYRCGGWSGLLATVFPTVAYDSADAVQRETARHLLDAREATPASLRRAYLRRWGQYTDTNFAAAVRRMGLRLEEPEAAQ